MKYLFLVFISAPVFACKMTAEGWAAKSKTDAMTAVTKLTGRKDLLARRDKNQWIIRTTKPSCVEYRVEVHGGNGDCKTSTKIISKKPCP